VARKDLGVLKNFRVKGSCARLTKKRKHTRPATNLRSQSARSREFRKTRCSVGDGGEPISREFAFPMESLEKSTLIPFSRDALVKLHARVEGTLSARAPNPGCLGARTHTINRHVLSPM
jgi:hypothetical protein